MSWIQQSNEHVSLINIFQESRLVHMFACTKQSFAGLQFGRYVQHAVWPLILQAT